MRSGHAILFDIFRAFQRQYAAAETASERPDGDVYACLYL